jgi:hypothetical protein
LRQEKEEENSKRSKLAQVINKKIQTIYTNIDTLKTNFGDEQGLALCIDQMRKEGREEGEEVE